MAGRARDSLFRPSRLYPLLALLGLLPVLPIMIKGSPVLNNDMLVAYFCYFQDYHKNWSWTHPLVFWSSSYQCGMPMHAYWQSGYLYPVTWILFGPLPAQLGMYLFYAFHFSLGIFGFLKLGPRLRLTKPASLWAGLCFALSGTMLARYEHATFLAGWAWIPAVLSAFLALRDRPGLRALLVYALCVALQAFGGHPQASIVTALLIAFFTVTSMLRRRVSAPAAAGPVAAAAPKLPGPRARAAWLLGGHALALLYCAPLLLPFLKLVDQTDRYDGTAWEEGKASDISAQEKLETGVFSFRKFSTGGVRPLHLVSLASPHALGTPSNASWWGGEVWGEVFLYLGALGFFFCFAASWQRASFDMRVLWMIGLISLWLACGAHFGASQALYHVPILNNFRRPARFVILFVLALAALSGHGFQRWTARGHFSRRFMVTSVLLLALALLLLALRASPALTSRLLDLAQHVKRLDPGKDYAGKMAALLGRWSADAAFIALSAAALGFCALASGRAARWRHALLFLVLLADLLRVHWDHFYRFPASFYREPPATAAVLDKATSPFWRVSHYLEYPGLEMWQMHNDPLAHFTLLEREKLALSCGIHAVFGYRHVSAHLPLLWKWEPATTPADKATRYLFSNRELAAHHGDSLRLLGRFGEVNAYELKDWRPRIENLSRNLRVTGADSQTCAEGYAGYRGLCVREKRDGEISVLGTFSAGDTLEIRERFQDEWLYRIDRGAWQKPLETPDHFLALPATAAASSMQLTYRPVNFYRLVSLCALATLLLLAAFGLIPRLRARA